ncbi:kinase-like protein [Trametes coccinea BRFM310]|uniref:Kinase-like protein n=1 Tax=Trametes coccinea (strain BRFM310) TaxID=1353009 RepID=A0A1Y2IZI3_TRAC3|nr:kinase-like protein [Trametes coccinea BRFM310]
MSSRVKRTGGEYGEMRASIDVTRLNAYCKAGVPAIETPVVVKQFKSGLSNPTYLITDARSARFVLRKKPSGTLLSKTAHQIEREYAVLRALHAYNISSSATAEKRIPIPEPIALCEDTHVIGTPFYIMQYIEGRIFTDPYMPGLSLQDQRECWLDAVRILGKLALLDPTELGLSNLAPAIPYFPRQIKSLARIAQVQASAVDMETGEPTGQIPLFEEMIGWYKANLPDERKMGLRLVHGDYKLDNLVYHPTENRVIGLLDWELCTLGSPLADFGNLIVPWSIPKGTFPKGITITAEFKDNLGETPISLVELEREYCLVTRQPYPMPEMVFARSWMLFRSAVVMQGVAARYARRQASSDKANLYKQNFPSIGLLAHRTVVEAGMFDSKVKL